MLKRRNIYKWLIFIFFICFFSSYSFASTNNSELNNSEYKEISDPSINEFSNDSSFIAYRGTLPETIDQKWENSIGDCWLNLTHMGPSYSEFDKSIKSIASSNEMLIIEIRSAYKGEVNNSRIDAIYQKIEDYCEQQEGISDVPVVFMWAHDEEDLPLPDYGPQIFEEIKTDSRFIATRGTMPVITYANEKVEWEEKAEKCIHSFRDDLQPYKKSSGGSIVAYGYDYRGYIFVDFDRESLENINDSLIDEIYLIIKDHSEQEGVSEVPVVFEWGEKVNVTLAPINGLYVNESNNTNLSKKKEKVVGNKTINKIPGFTSITGVLGILSLLIIKRSV